MIPILKKVIEELGKESPRLDYVRGMLETVVEMQPMEFVDQDGAVWKPTPDQVRAIKDAEKQAIEQKSKLPYTKRPVTDESSMLDAQAAAVIAGLPPVQYE